MNPKTIEDDLVARLQAQITGASAPKIEAWNRNAFEYVRKQRNGAILVRYARSNYQAPIPNRNKTIWQEREVRWNIAILKRALAEDTYQDAYDTLQDVRQALVGYVPGTQTSNTIANSTVLYIINDGFVGEKDGTFLWEMDFAHVLPESTAT